MACEVEVLNGKNGQDLTEKLPLEDDSDNEILALKRSLKDKLLTDNVNGSINGNHDGASTSSSSSVINNNGTIENGIRVDSEVNEAIPEARRQTPERSAKRKLGKMKKESVTKSKKQTPIKKVDVPPEEESTQSEQSFTGTESPYKDAEGDDASTIDVINDDEVIDVVKDDEAAAEINLNISTEAEASAVHKAKDVTGENVFYRWCNSARFSISPRKQSAVSSSEDVSSCSSAPFESKLNSYSFRGISGRRALHRSSFAFESSEAEPSVSNQSLKRKSLSDSPESPQRKRFITSLTELSPGWKFFSSPFTSFWTPNKKTMNTTASNSTPLRQLHEDVDLEDSLAVNVGDTEDISMHEDLEVEKDKMDSENQLKEKKIVAEEGTQSVESSWRCIVM